MTTTTTTQPTTRTTRPRRRSVSARIRARVWRALTRLSGRLTETDRVDAAVGVDGVRVPTKRPRPGRRRQGWRVVIARVGVWGRRRWSLVTDPTGAVEAAAFAEVLLVAAVRAGQVQCVNHPDRLSVTVVTVDGQPVAVCESCMLGDGGPGAAVLGAVAA
jgi:hypothetical protein